MLEKMRVVQIDDQVKDVLQGAQVEGNLIRITQQLDRDLYVRVNKVLEALGGKWNRGMRGHVFAEPAADKLAQALGTGKAVDIKKSYEFFPTPGHVVMTMLNLAPPSAGMKILEPSAGRGAIADVVRDMCPDCTLELVEIEEGNRKDLKARGHKIVGKDFLKFKKKGYDRVFMNPPFSKQQDIDHVTHALKLVKPGGSLVSVMSAGVRLRTNKKAEKFKELMEKYNATVEDIPAGTFEESGTGVNTILVSFEVPE